MEIVGMLRLSGRRVPFCCGKNRVRRAAAVQTVQNRLPRACGEKPVLSTMLRAASGSPPRMRGEATSIIAICIMERITPACAGRSAQPSEFLMRLPDHPRVCGEKRKAKDSLVRRLGSPPRVRGEDCSGNRGIALRRITPACAGRRTLSRATAAAARDHPRVCGEKPIRRVRISTFLGSPPRVRGEAHTRRVHRQETRITPACAGRSFFP